MRHYCTYFDSRYLSRGLALYESLCRWGGDFQLHALSLDGETFDRLTSLGAGNLRPVALDTLERWDDDLVPARRDRSLISYYFTLTSAFARFLFLTQPDIAMLTYLDADLFFFGDPEEVFDEIGDASIAIVPHRFSQHNAALRSSGLFNVGWLSWRRDAVGFACLEDYRQECLAWCHDYADGDRFADQRYLDVWPMRYPGVQIIAHTGANLAPWNLDSNNLTVLDGDIQVSGRPLIFFHFHRLRRSTHGFERNLDGYLSTSPGSPDSAVLDRIYGPYEALLNRLDEEGGLSATLRDPVQPAPLDGWEYRPQGWQRNDPSVPGWAEPSAIETMAERFEIMRRRVGTTLPVGGDLRMHNDMMTIAYAASRAARDGRLSVLDWGGGFGSCRLALDMLLPDLAIDYHCHSLAPIAGHRQAAQVDATFDDDEAAFSSRYDLVIASASLQHCEDWRGTLERLGRAATRFLLIARTPVVCSVPSFVMVQRAFGGDYRTAWQCWAIGLTDALTTIKAAGLRMERQFPLQQHPYVQNAPEQPELRGFLCAALPPAPPAPLTNS